MPIANRCLTLAEYLTDTAGVDTRYELVDGMLVDIGAESRLNEKIALWLLQQFLLVASIDLIARGTQIAVTSLAVTARNPDLLILTPALDQMLLQTGQSLITAAMPAPVLVVEVVSPGEPGTPNYDRDYLEKPPEYAARGILEFWQVDPNRAIVRVLTLEGGTYRPREFRGSDVICSPTFPNLHLTADQVLRAGR